jgi:hypothetical protein
MTTITRFHSLGVEQVTLHVILDQSAYATNPNLFHEYQLIISHKIFSFDRTQPSYTTQEDYDLFTTSPLQYGDIRVVKELKRLYRKYNKELYYELAKEYVNNLF